MARFQTANNVRVKLRNAISDTDTSITVDKAEVPNQDPPQVQSGRRYHLTIIDSFANPTKIEVVNVTGVFDNGSSWTLNVERGQEGTTPQAFTEAILYMAATAELMDSKADDSTLAAVAKSGDKADVGLDQVDNTADLDKPISTATQSALDDKADTSSLGTAATTDSTDYATAAQGNTADTAVQPSDLGTAASEDASNLRDRSTHTGTQPISSVDGLQAALDEAEAEWGNITGDLTDQTDLQGELDAKYTIASGYTEVTPAGGTVTFNMENGPHFKITMTQNAGFEFSNMSGKAGQSGVILIEQDSTGGRTFTLSSDAKTPVGGASITQSTGSNTKSILNYVVVSNNEVFVNYIGDFQ